LPLFLPFSVGISAAFSHRLCVTKGNVPKKRRQKRD
jgi:hypothetical protein